MKGERSKRSQKKPPNNPFGLGRRALEGVRESLDHGWFDEASETYEASVGAEAPPFAELVLWLALQPEGKPQLSWFEHLPTTTSPAQRLEILARLTFDESERKQVAGYDGSLRAMVRRLHHELATDPGAVREVVAARGDWPVWMAEAMAFAEWLHGAELPLAHARSLALRFAEDQVHATFGSELLPGREREVTARELGEAIVGPSAWAELLRHADRTHGTHRVSLMPEAFATGDWLELAGTLGSCDHKPSIEDEQAFVDVVLRRGDPDAALLALGDRLRTTRSDSTLAELAELVVVNRRLDRGESVDDLATRVRFVSTLPFALDGTRRLLAALPEDVRRTVMKDDRDRPGDALSIIGLADQFDEATLHAYLERGSLSGEVIGRLGARVIGAVEARLAAESHPTLQIKLSMALFFALTIAAEQGAALTDSQLAFAGAYPASHPRFATLLAALPEAAQGTMWRAAAASNAKLYDLIQLLRQRPPAADVLADIVPTLVTRDPDRDWENMPEAIRRAMRGRAVKTRDVSPAMKLFEACASAAEGDTRQIYAFELGGEPPPAGSLTRLGAAPRRGDKQRHLFTIDLHDAPHLGVLYPGARALALFVPRQPGDALSAYASTRLDALDDVAANALPSADDAHTFRVVPVCVPDAAFDDAESTLRQLLVNLPGYALGEAITIQEEPDLGGDFILQLDDSFGINLGDAGRLYVYGDGATADCA